jgi:hypothetical protein
VEGDLEPYPVERADGGGEDSAAFSPVVTMACRAVL